MRLGWRRFFARKKGLVRSVNPSTMRAIVVNTSVLQGLTAVLVATVGPVGVARAARVEGSVVIEGWVAPKGAPAAAPPTDSACPPVAPRALATAEGGVPDVVVRLPAGAAKPPKTPPPALTIEQKGCEYRPRVAALVRGQELTIKSADATLHNVHAWRDGETQFNLAQPAGTAPIVRALDASVGEIVKLTCDVHAWMTAWVVIVDHPVFAVTDDAGAFALDLPPGRHTLQAWHPTLGSREVAVTVAKGRPAKVRITFPNPKTIEKTQP